MWIKWTVDLELIKQIACQIFRVREDLLALMLNRLMFSSAYSFSLPIRLWFFTYFLNSLYIWWLLFARITVKNQSNRGDSPRSVLIIKKGCIYVWLYAYVHIYLYVSVFALKQQASGFNHMQNVITLFFLGHVYGIFMILLSPHVDLKGKLIEASKRHLGL